MDWHRVVHAGLDTAGPQLRANLVPRPAGRYSQRVLVIHVSMVRVHPRALEPPRYVGGVILRVLAAPLGDGVELPKLHQTDRGLHLGQPEVVRDRVVQIGLIRIGLVPQPGAGARHLRVTGDHHPAFASGDVLGGVKRVDGGPECAERAAADRRAHRLTCVLDER